MPGTLLLTTLPCFPLSKLKGREGCVEGDDSSGGNVGGKVNSACELPRTAQDQERSTLSVSVTEQIFTKLGLCARNCRQLAFQDWDL